MATINTYLTFNGDCEAAFNFYKSVFGGEFTFFGKFKDMPAMGGTTCAAADSEKIMHVSFPIGRGSVLMGSDSGDGRKANFGNNFAISISTDSEAEADKMFKGLSNGGQVIMPMAKAFWGAYFGMFTDKFGINWMVNFDYKQAS
jgi:PhnB protein